MYIREKIDRDGASPWFALTGGLICGAIVEIMMLFDGE